MPRTFLIRSNTNVTDGPAESNHGDCDDEELLGSTDYEEGSYTSDDIQYGNDPMDLSTSRSTQLRTSSHDNSSPEIQAYKPGLPNTKQESSTLRKMNNVRTGEILRDKCALPMVKQGTRSDLYLDEGNRNVSQNIYRESMHQYTREVYSDNGRWSPDAYAVQNGSTPIHGYSSRCSREPMQRTSTVLKGRPKKVRRISELTKDRTFSLQDLTRMIHDESGMQPSRPSYMSLLEDYYAEAVAKRNIIRDLRRDLHSSDLSDRDPRGSKLLQTTEQQYHRDMFADGLNPKHRQLFSDLNGDMHVYPTRASGIHIANNRKRPYSSDGIASSRNTPPMYQPRWGHEGLIGLEPRTTTPTLQSLRKARLMQQQHQHPTRLSRTAVLLPDTEPPNKNLSMKSLEQQSILKNHLLRKRPQFLHEAPTSSSASPLESQQVWMPPVSRPTRKGRPQSSVLSCPKSNEMMSSTADESELPNGQNLQSYKEGHQLQSRPTQIIQNVSEKSSLNNDKELHIPATCQPALNYSKDPPSYGLTNIPGGESKSSSTSDKESQHHTAYVSPYSTSLPNPNTLSHVAEDVPFKPTPATSLKQKLRCNFCFSTFPSEKAYTNHMAVDHKETKPHICGFCGKGFHDKFDLKRHYRTHTGVRPYKCSICPRAFTQRCSLETHVNKVHDMQLNFAFKERRKKIYVCENCGNSVNDAFEHYLHMWAVHSRLAMPKRLRQKVLKRIKYILKTRNGGDKIGDELLANAQVVTQSIRSLRELG